MLLISLLGLITDTGAVPLQLTQQRRLLDSSGTNLEDTSSCPASSCLDIKTRNPSASSQTYWLTLGDNIQQAYCDMKTDGGGWKIFYAATGADNDVVLNSDIMRSGDPLNFVLHNMSRQFKKELSTLASETLLYRNSGTWIKADRTAFDSTLDTENQHSHYTVTLTANNGIQSLGYLGWSNYNIRGGDDFNLSQADGATCCGLVSTQGVDHHNGIYYHLNRGCARHYLYSYSTAVADTDADYDANTALGSWNTTASYTSAEGGSLVVYAAMR